ncbi:hypothetical protein BWI15_13520 [Kribbella sp. ALI-6-A]|nr:hypothetical protein BWI15_13520 [Kribbella sp. ALI-6-A]
MRTAVAVLAITAVPAGAVAVPSLTGTTTAMSSTATTCPTGWGSLPEANTFVTTGILTTVRSGRHSCFDRVVFDVSGTTPGYGVRYVSNVFRPGAGHLMPLRGGAKLQIVLGVNEFDDAGHWAYQPSRSDELTNVTGYRTFRQIAYAGSTEGAAWIGIGLRARLPFRVHTLAGPGTGSRVVLDVAHTW